MHKRWKINKLLSNCKASHISHIGTKYQRTLDLYFLKETSMLARQQKYNAKVSGKLRLWFYLKYWWHDWFPSLMWFWFTGFKLDLIQPWFYISVMNVHFIHMKKELINKITSSLVLWIGNRLRVKDWSWDCMDQYGECSIKRKAIFFPPTLKTLLIFYWLCTRINITQIQHILSTLKHSYRWLSKWLE